MHSVHSGRTNEFITRYNMKMKTSGSPETASYDLSI